MAPPQEEADDAEIQPQFPRCQSHNGAITTQRVLEGGRTESQRSTTEEALSVEGLAATEQTSSSMTTPAREAHNDATELDKALEISRQLQKQIEDVHATFEARSEATNRITQQYEQLCKTECERYRKVVVKYSKLLLEQRVLAVKTDLNVQASSNATRCNRLEEENAGLKDMLNNQMESFICKRDAQNMKVQKRWRENLKDSFRRDCTKFQGDLEERERKRTDAALDYLTAQSKQVSQAEEELRTEQESHGKLKNECEDLRAELISERAKMTQLRGELAAERDGTKALKEALEKEKDSVEAMDRPVDERWTNLNDCFNQQKKRMDRLLVRERIVGAEKAGELELWKAKAEELQRTVKEVTVQQPLPTPGNKDDKKVFASSLQVDKR
ncbi:hypothetical protein IWX90DRAFT_482117 [Phyllosticta citrichinensis]|uniref:Uncharacterized protein n=1 Tax=Phyllosticta citrichinensis TaxID=1130410 RepID=A0ABR1Y5F8_9PEZI